MKLFISWSGEQSRHIAEELYGWIPSVLQAVKPYFSQESIVKGSRWTPDLAAGLHAARMGVIVVTRANADHPWLLFEAGALANKFGADEAAVASVFFGLKPTDIDGPLTQFQGTIFDKKDFHRLIRGINAKLEDRLTDSVVDDAFESRWPRLAEAVDAIMKNVAPEAPVKREDSEMLTELLVITRELLRQSVSAMAMGSSQSTHSFPLDFDSIVAVRHYGPRLSAEIVERPGGLKVLRIEAGGRRSIVPSTFEEVSHAKSAADILLATPGAPDSQWIDNPFALFKEPHRP